jgi:hypothetical protein
MGGQQGPLGGKRSGGLPILTPADSGSGGMSPQPLDPGL